MTYHIPGKTFLLGEYSALVGGSVLGLATAPGFEVSYTNFKDTSDHFIFPFPPESPAAAIYQQYPEIRFKFHDLVKVGGFGRSTAEYLSVLLPTLTEMIDFSEIKTQYQKFSQTSGSLVSGLDLAIQLYGRVTHFNAKNQSCVSGHWRFSELEFFLISTGTKIKTHEHVQQVNLNSLKNFPAVSDSLIPTYFGTDGNDFVRAINEWTRFLASQNLVHENSVAIQSALLKNADIEAAKPCGALGADVILVLCKVENTSSVRKTIADLGLAITAQSKNLCDGILGQLGEKESQGLDVD